MTTKAKTATLDIWQLREQLRVACEKAGSQKAWASSAGLSNQYVCDVLAGRRDPGDGIANALGYEKRVTYVRKDHWEEKESK